MMMIIIFLFTDILPAIFLKCLFVSGPKLIHKFHYSTTNNTLLTTLQKWDIVTASMYNSNLVRHVQPLLNLAPPSSSKATATFENYSFKSGICESNLSDQIQEKNILIPTGSFIFQSQSFCLCSSTQTYPPHKNQ
jgi:hypothetical protein